MKLNITPSTVLRFLVSIFIVTVGYVLLEIPTDISMWKRFLGFMCLYFGFLGYHNAIRQLKAA